jgi:hypothetical protein
MISSSLASNKPMKRLNEILRRLTRALAVPALISLIYIMAAITLFNRQIFIDRHVISLEDLSVAAGFSLFILYNIISIVWLFGNAVINGPKPIRNIPILVMGIFCLIGLTAEKVLADEIGRELLLDMETTGERIILYGIICLQIVYTCSTLRILRYREGNGKEVQ